MLETRHVVILLHGSLEKADGFMDVFASQHGFHKSQIDQHNQSRLVNITNSRLINTTNPQIDFLSAT